MDGLMGNKISRLKLKLHVFTDYELYRNTLKLNHIDDLSIITYNIEKSIERKTNTIKNAIIFK